MNRRPRPPVLSIMDCKSMRTSVLTIIAIGALSVGCSNNERTTASERNPVATPAPPPIATDAALGAPARDAAVPPPPPAAVVKAPVVVFWGGASAQSTLVNIDLPSAVLSKGQNKTLQKLALAALDPNGGPSQLKNDDVPAYLKTGTNYVALLSGRTAKLALQKVNVQQGASQMYLEVSLDGVPGLKADEEILVIPTTELKGDPSARVATSIDVAAPTSAAALDAMRKELQLRLPKKRQPLLAAPLAAAHTKLFTGTFGGSATGLVVISERPKLNAIVLIDDQGAIKHVAALTTSAQSDDPWCEVPSIVDTNADGVDEVLLRCSYSEGGSTLLLHWTGSKFESRSLTSGGA